MRLIDAGAMNEELFYKELGGKDTLITAECAFNMIKTQPTVNVFERIIEEIKKSPTDDDGLIVRDGNEPMIWKSKAIAIVKQEINKGLE